MASADVEKLLKEYESVKGPAKNFCDALVEQIEKLLSEANISVAVPIESRVKSWDSIKNKLERVKLELKSILQLRDLVGIRLILPFRRDLDRCVKLIEENFEIADKEDTATRLSDSQFGYQSYHYVLKLPESWLSIPTFKGCDKYSAEIQVRTLAQHIWAVASHNLQYKQEKNVPQTVRRSIYRVSALLETVDLEFERVLNEREEYVETLEPETHDELLNVDLLREITDKYLPIKNREPDEPYSELLEDLSRCGINKTSELISLIKEQLDNALKDDRVQVALVLAGEATVLKTSSDSEKVYYINRAEKEAYCTHVGLVRSMLGRKFGPFSWMKDSPYKSK